MPNGNIRNGITVPEKNDIIAERMTHINQTTFLSRRVMQKNKNSNANPNDAHKMSDGITHIVCGRMLIPNSGAITAIGMENSKSDGIHSPIVREMT